MKSDMLEFPSVDKATMKSNRCVVLPANVPMIAHSLKRKNQNWIARANSANDLIIQIGDSNFHLHKLAMVSRSEYLNRLVLTRANNIEDNTTTTTTTIRIDNLPGGRKTLELVVKFCYGWKFDMTKSNIASLYSAANFLEMSEEIEQQNLISMTESFLTFLLFSSWKDTFCILKSCESISHWAKELQIVKRCSEAIAWKSCAIQNVQSKTNNPWWFEDVSLLRIDHFIEVIQLIKKRGMKSNLVGSCIQYWTTKWFSEVTLGFDHNVTPKHMTIKLHRVSIECLIKMLPIEENSVSCNFLLQLLKVGMVLKINDELLCVVERRVVLMLEQCSVQDLLVKNHGDKDSLYDVDVVVKVLQCYVCGMSSNHAAKLQTVGRLVDGYLSQVARDQRVKVESFKLLLEALPQNARDFDDNLYRAIDMYLKAHPYLTEEERENVCSVLEYHRLSQEARMHVMKNDRLPLKLSTQFVLLEQVNMSWTMASNGSYCQRTKTQTNIRVSKDFNRQMNHEIKVMRKDVEMMKSQLLDLNTCKMKIQKQLKICTH